MIEVEYIHFAAPKELMNLGNPYVPSAVNK